MILIVFDHHHRSHDNQFYVCNVSHNVFVFKTTSSFFGSIKEFLKLLNTLQITSFFRNTPKIIFLYHRILVMNFLTVQIRRSVLGDHSCFLPSFRIFLEFDWICKLLLCLQNVHPFTSGGN